MGRGGICLALVPGLPRCAHFVWGKFQAFPVVIGGGGGTLKTWKETSRGDTQLCECTHFARSANHHEFNVPPSFRVSLVSMLYIEYHV